MVAEVGRARERNGTCQTVPRRAGQFGGCLRLLSRGEERRAYFCGSDSTPLAAFEQARRCYQGSYEVVRVAGGHFMHRESPEEFTRELIRLLGDHVA